MPKVPKRQEGKRERRITLRLDPSWPSTATGP